MCFLFHSTVTDSKHVVVECRTFLRIPLAGVMSRVTWRSRGLSGVTVINARIYSCDIVMFDNAFMECHARQRNT